MEESLTDCLIRVRNDLTQLTQVREYLNSNTQTVENCTMSWRTIEAFNSILANCNSQEVPEVEAMNTLLDGLFFLVSNNREEEIWTHFGFELGAICVKILSAIERTQNFQDLFCKMLQTVDVMCEKSSDVWKAVARQILNVLINKQFEFEFLDKIYTMYVEILRKIDILVLNSFAMQNLNLLRTFSMLVRSLGDFEAQQKLMELILIHFSERKLVEDFFTDDQKNRELFKVLLFVDFEGDCRTYLNALNKRGVGRKVYSICCNILYLGGCFIEAPNGRKFIWMDANKTSERLSFKYCELDVDKIAYIRFGELNGVTLEKDTNGNYCVTIKCTDLRGVCNDVKNNDVLCIALESDNLQENIVDFVTFLEEIIRKGKRRKSPDVRLSQTCEEILLSQHSENYHLKLVEDSKLRKELQDNAISSSVSQKFMSEIQKNALKLLNNEKVVRQTNSQVAPKANAVTPGEVIPESQEFSQSSFVESLNRNLGFESPSDRGHSFEDAIPTLPFRASDEVKGPHKLFQNPGKIFEFTEKDESKDENELLEANKENIPVRRDRRRAKIFDSQSEECFKKLKPPGLKNKPSMPKLKKRRTLDTSKMEKLQNCDKNSLFQSSLLDPNGYAYQRWLKPTTSKRSNFWLEKLRLLEEKNKANSSRISEFSEDLEIEMSQRAVKRIRKKKTEKTTVNKIKMMVNSCDRRRKNPKVAPKKETKVSSINPQGNRSKKEEELSDRSSDCSIQNRSPIKRINLMKISKTQKTNRFLNQSSSNINRSNTSCYDVHIGGNQETIKPENTCKTRREKPKTLQTERQLNASKSYLEENDDVINFRPKSKNKNKLQQPEKAGSSGNLYFKHYRSVLRSPKKEKRKEKPEDCSFSKKEDNNTLEKSFTKFRNRQSNNSTNNVLKELNINAEPENDEGLVKEPKTTFRVVSKKSKDASMSFRKDDELPKNDLTRKTNNSRPKTGVNFKTTKVLSQDKTESKRLEQTLDHSFSSFKSDTLQRKKLEKSFSRAADKRDDNGNNKVRQKVTGLSKKSQLEASIEEFKTTTRNERKAVNGTKANRSNESLKEQLNSAEHRRGQNDSISKQTKKSKNNQFSTSLIVRQAEKIDFDARKPERKTASMNAKKTTESLKNCYMTRTRLKEMQKGAAESEIDGRVKTKVQTSCEVNESFRRTSVHRSSNPQNDVGKNVRNRSKVMNRKDDSELKDFDFSWETPSENVKQLTDKDKRNEEEKDSDKNDNPNRSKEFLTTSHIESFSRSIQELQLEKPTSSEDEECNKNLPDNYYYPSCRTPSEVSINNEELSSLSENQTEKPEMDSDNDSWITKKHASKRNTFVEMSDEDAKSSKQEAIFPDCSEEENQKSKPKKRNRSDEENSVTKKRTKKKMKTFKIPNRKMTHPTLNLRLQKSEGKLRQQTNEIIETIQKATNHLLDYIQRKSGEKLVGYFRTAEDVVIKLPEADDTQTKVERLRKVMAYYEAKCSVNEMCREMDSQLTKLRSALKDVKDGSLDPAQKVKKISDHLATMITSQIDKSITKETEARKEKFLRCLRFEVTDCF